MKNKTIKCIALAALSVFAFSGAQAQTTSATYQGPTWAETGLTYYDYLNALAFYTGQGVIPSPDNVYNAILPYGTNAATYAYLQQTAEYQSSYYYSLGSLIYAYYRYLGAYYAVLGYTNPTSANATWNSYASYAAQASQQLFAAGSYYYGYWSDLAQPYYVQTTSSFF